MAATISPYSGFLEVEADKFILQELYLSEVQIIDGYDRYVTRREKWQIPGWICRQGSSFFLSIRVDVKEPEKSAKNCDVYF